MDNDSNKKTQVCKCCGRELPLSEFTLTRIGLLKTCRECVCNNQKKARAAKKAKAAIEGQITDAKMMRLHQFTPRELMAELKRRGYKFKMEYTETHIIDSKDIEI